jgi:hypothetical protein
MRAKMRRVTKRQQRTYIHFLQESAVVPSSRRFQLLFIRPINPNSKLSICKVERRDKMGEREKR